VPSYRSKNVDVRNKYWPTY